jgi:hypothetical protein
MVSESDTRNLPPTVAAKLTAIHRKRLAVRRMETLLLTAVVLIGAMLLAMAIDWLVVLFNPLWRHVLTLTALGLAGCTCVLALIRLGLDHWRLSTVAREVDLAVPQSEERWSTVTELAESTDPPEILGSAVFIDQVAQEAARMDALVEMPVMVSRRGVTRRTMILGAVLAILALAFLVGGRTTWVLLERFWAPGAEIAMTQVTSLTGDRAIGKGDPLLIEVRIDGRLRDAATILIRKSGSVAQTEDMVVSNKPGVPFAYALKNVNESFEYRIRSGDGQTPWHRIEAVERPAIAQVRFRIIPPQYTKLPETRSDTLAGTFETVEGSRLEMEVLPTKPLEKMEMKVGDSAPAPLQKAEGNWYRVEKKLTESMAFSLQLTDQKGLSNAKPLASRIDVYPDRPPEVEITSPDKELVVKSDDHVAIEVKAKDDFGVRSLELVVTSDQDGEEKVLKVIPMPLDKPGEKEVRSKMDLDLKPFNLKQGEALNYPARATDTRDAVSAASQKSATPDSGQKPDDRTASAQNPGEQKSPEQQSADKASQDKDKQSQDQKSESSEKNSADPSKSSEADKDAAKPSGNSEPQPQPGQATASSQEQRLQINEFADSSEGKRRQELQTFLEQLLAQLDAALAAAEKPTYDLAENAKATKPWQAAEEAKLAGARGELAKGDEMIDKLAKASAGTPFAFVGRELQDIDAAHVMPARGTLGEAGKSANKPAEQGKQLEQGGYHITRAREQLAALTKSYGEAKDALDREEKLGQGKGKSPGRGKNKLTRIPVPAAPGAPDRVGAGRPGDDKDWATLASKLEKDLRQARDNAPPEQYQQLINEYFRTVGEAMKVAK